MSGVKTKEVFFLREMRDIARFRVDRQTYPSSRLQNLKIPLRLDVVQANDAMLRDLALVLVNIEIGAADHEPLPEPNVAQARLFGIVQVAGVGYQGSIE